MRKFLLIAIPVLVALALVAPIATGGQGVQISARVGWTPLFYVEGPTTISFQASGFAQTASVPVWHFEGPADPGSGPEGQTGGLTCVEATGDWYTVEEFGPCFAWDAYFGELVVRVGGGEGWGLDGGTQIVVPEGVSGILYLAVNDYAYTLHDNNGQFTVTFK